MKKTGIFAGICTAFIAVGISIPLKSAAYYEYRESVFGDINSDLAVDFADVKCYNDIVVENYAESPKNEYLDLDGDTQLDVFDELIARKISVGQIEKTQRNECVDNGENYDISGFTEPYIQNVDYSLPSQGDARLLGFYVDFPDMKYDYEPTLDEIRRITFGNEKVRGTNYPFESIAAFFKRSSKGAMNLSGDFLRYTAKHEIAYYEKDYDAIVKECLDAFADEVDYSEFDGNGDKIIDAVLVNVPESSDKKRWWPSTGLFEDGSYKVDGMSVGMDIIGNAGINGDVYWVGYVTTYAHELCHAMGLPDYYLVNSTDSEGFHGPAGANLLDVDGASDLDCFSKLMLGWYKDGQILTYDGEGSYTLKNAQSDDGNCLVIKRKSASDGYFGEYMIAEYSTTDGNNIFLDVFDDDRFPIDSGVRVFHILADVYKYSNGAIFKYESRSQFLNGNDGGYRLIRLVGDACGGNMLKVGSGENAISDETPGFAWYDIRQRESVSTGLVISAESCENGEFTILIEKNN